MIKLRRCDGWEKLWGKNGQIRRETDGNKWKRMEMNGNKWKQMEADRKRVRRTKENE